ncbi:MAG TPA: phosphopantetheine-binding protein [Acidimicrobiales bacterium]|nr:phosphopantetheine-binding protein [Acidimicrobiales bacterium]
MPTAILDFETFADRLRDGLRINAGPLSVNSRLVEDLRLDSFDLTELLVVVEELGVQVPEEAAEEFETVGDVYQEYVKRASDTETAGDAP